MGARKQLQMLEAGAPAPDFQLSTLSGSGVSLRELLPQGPVLLAFFKISCPVCQLTLPFLDRIHRNQARPALSVYGISQDDRDSTSDFNQRFGITFPVLLDTSAGGYVVSNAYGISQVPSLLLVEGDGTISWTLEGFRKQEIAALGAKAGVNPFWSDEYVPEWKAG